jgi:hypothetical protein
MITTRYRQMHLENLQKPSAIKFCPTCEIFLQPPKGTLKCHLSNHRVPFFYSMPYIAFTLGKDAKVPTRSGNSCSPNAASKTPYPTSSPTQTFQPVVRNPSKSPPTTPTRKPAPKRFSKLFSQQMSKKAGRNLTSRWL